MPPLSDEMLKRIDDAVDLYAPKQKEFLAFAQNLTNDLLAKEIIAKAVHSTKVRAKDPEHLRGKLKRKCCERADFLAEPSSVFSVIHDLAGVRLLHLHTGQIDVLHRGITEVIEDGYVLGEPPEAKTWDAEYADLFKRVGLQVSLDPSLYTSVHYIVKLNSKSPKTCELQVRTLAEEVWGEVSHAINYPKESDSVACREQLKALARIVSGSSRLVDSIIASHEDHANRAAGPALGG